MSTLNLGSWIKGKDDQPPVKSECVLVCESLMMELDYQMQESEQQVRDKEREEKRKQTGVDYTWLLAGKPKPFEMPQLERMQLEEICMKIKPVECTRAIGMFRDTLLREPPTAEMPRLMRSVILHILDTRSKEETMGEWMMKSLTKLKPASPRVMPVSDPDDLEMQKSSSSLPWTTNVQQSSMDNSSNGNARLFDQVENLPV